MGNPYPATFIDQNAEGRLVGELDFTDPANRPGGSTPANLLRLLGPFQVLETDSEVTLWTPAIGDVIVEVWLIVTTTFSAPGAKIEVYTDVKDLFEAGQVAPLVADANTQDSSRRWPLPDWRASTYPGPDTGSVPTTMRTASPVLADVLGTSGSGGVAEIYALVATPV